MSKLVLKLILLLIPVLTLDAETITLEACYDKAMKSYPVAKQSELYTKDNILKQANISNDWLPTLDLDGQATYQSDVTQVNVTIPPILLPNGSVFTLPKINVPIPSKDQYKLTLDVSQMIYDGGIVSARSIVQTAETKTQQQAAEVELYKLKDQVNQLYFTILILQENSKLIDNMIKTISEKIKSMESAVKNGAAIQSNLDYLNAEILKLDQQQIEIQSGRSSAIDALSILINSKLSDDVKLEVPAPGIDHSEKPDRPEVHLFDLQENMLDASSEVIGSTKYPKLFGFGQFGYGKPGLNMLSNTFEPYFYGGIKLSWNIWDWSASSNDLQSIAIQKEIINTKKEAFNKNLEIALNKELSVVSEYEEITKKDNQIIDLKLKIGQASSSKLDNGIITSADYISDLNEQVQAMINLETHKLELIRAKINYNTLWGTGDLRYNK